MSAPANGKCQRPLSAVETGWPRPKRPWKPAPDDRDYMSESRRDMPELLPAPWINGPCVEDDQDWHSFRPDYQRAHHERLCAICGDPLGARILLGSMNGRALTAGPGGHPRCMWLSVNTCPHLVERKAHGIVAWEYIGPGVGYEIDAEHLEDGYGSGETIATEARPLLRGEVKLIAKADPLGLSTDPIDTSNALESEPAGCPVAH